MTIHIASPYLRIIPDGHVVSAALRASGKVHRIAFAAGQAPVSTRADPFLCLGLIAAMRAGARLEVKGRVSPRLVQSLPAIQERFTSWYPRFQRIEVIAREQVVAARAGSGVGCFFTAGVDSFYTLFKHLDEIDQLIYVHGFDIDLRNQPVRRKTRLALQEVSTALGKPLVEVSSNLRRFTDRRGDWGKHFHGAGMAGVALFLAPRFRKVYLAGGRIRDDDALPWGSHPLVDHLWGTENLEIVHDGCEATRLEKVMQIARHDIVLRTLRVCWQNPGAAYNCGRCEKCLRTMTSLRLAGALDRCSIFEVPLDLERVAQAGVHHETHHRANLRAAEENDRDPALAAALRAALASEKRTSPH